MGAEQPLSHSRPAAGLRRPKQPPAPIQTTFVSDQLSKVQRPAPIETVVFHPPPPAPLREAPALSRRASRNLLGLFQKNNKSAVDFRTYQRQKELSEIREAQDEGGQLGRDSWPRSNNSTSAATTATTNTATSTTHTSVSFNNATKHRAPSEKPRPLKPIANFDPPPLFQAYPQAVKHGTLSTPVMSADAILKLGKKTEAVQLKSEDKSRRKGGNRLQPAQLERATKIFVLATSAYLLQYAGTGRHDRAPERIMQLGKDSAAFASDAIPGKHWVLQVSQSSLADGTVAMMSSSRSFLTTLGFRSDMKRPVSNFLLVMSSAEEMDSWLVAIRKEISALGGQSYKSDGGASAAIGSSGDPVQRLQQRPSRRIVIKPESSWPVESGGLEVNIDKDDAETAGATLPSEAPQHNAPEKPEAVAGDVAPSLPRRSSRRDRTEQPNGSTVPAVELEASVPLRLFDDNNSPTHQRHGSKDPLQEQRKPSFPSAPETHSLYKAGERTSTERSDSPPNFSIPTFSRRFSQGAKTVSTSTPPTSAGGSDCFADEETFRRESTVSELPPPQIPSNLSKESAEKSSPFGQEFAAIAVPFSPVRSSYLDNDDDRNISLHDEVQEKCGDEGIGKDDSNNPENSTIRLPEIPRISTPPERMDTMPSRFSSLEYSYGLLPWINASQQQGSLTEGDGEEGGKKGAESSGPALNKSAVTTTSPTNSQLHSTQTKSLLNGRSYSTLAASGGVMRLSHSRPSRFGVHDSQSMPALPGGIGASSIAEEAGNSSGDGQGAPLSLPLHNPEASASAPAPAAAAAATAGGSATVGAGPPKPKKKQRPASMTPSHGHIGHPTVHNHYHHRQTSGNITINGGQHGHGGFGHSATANRLAARASMAALRKDVAGVNLRTGNGVLASSVATTTNAIPIATPTPREQKRLSARRSFHGPPTAPPPRQPLPEIPGGGLGGGIAVGSAFTAPPVARIDEVPESALIF